MGWFLFGVGLGSWLFWWVVVWVVVLIDGFCLCWVVGCLCFVCCLFVDLGVFDWLIGLGLVCAGGCFCCLFVLVVLLFGFEFVY